MNMEQRAGSGAALLDVRLPHWQHRVNLRKLDLGTHFKCILGQCYGSYGDGIEALGLDDERARLHGFNVPRNAHGGAWFELEEAWRAEIIKRLG